VPGPSPAAPDERAEPFWQAALDSLPDSVAVLDHHGDILAVNEAWRRFAEANDGLEVGVGVNYLSVCERSEIEDPLALEVSGAVRDVLSGTRERYECIYPCHAPSQERWFRMQAVPFVGAGERRVVVTHHDITDRHQAQQRSREQAELLDAVGAAIIATDLDGMVTHWSEGAERLYGWRAAETMGRHGASIIDPSEERSRADEIEHAMLAEDQWEGQLEVCRRDGTRFPAYVRYQWVRDAERHPTGVIGVSVDMTERVAMERQLRGARDFLAIVTHTMPDGLFVLDLAGRVTLVNEAAETMLGWPASELLGEVVHEMIHALLPDGSARPAEERPFTRTDRSGAAVRVEDDVFERRDGSFMPVTYTPAPFVGETGEQGWVVAFSDISELKAREERVRRELESLSWVGRIRDALDENRFVLYAQPIIELATDTTVQHELLLRMIAANGEVIVPERFLPVAEQHGLATAIDRRVFDLALVHAAAGFRVALNLSADSVSDPGLFRFVEERLRVNAVDPRMVIFEITETALIHNEAVAQLFIEKVRGLNCVVALDDFGTGYGSFRYLKHLPVNLLKIDQEFVRDLDGATSEINRHVIRAIVTLARGLGQETIAEGVETESALAQLRELGVDYAQGYLFARPVPADQIFKPTQQED